MIVFNWVRNDRVRNDLVINDRVRSEWVRSDRVRNDRLPNKTTLVFSCERYLFTKKTFQQLYLCKKLNKILNSFEN